MFSAVHQTLYVSKFPALIVSPKRIRHSRSGALIGGGRGKSVSLPFPSMTAIVYATRLPAGCPRILPVYTPSPAIASPTTPMSFIEMLVIFMSGSRR